MLDSQVNRVKQDLSGLAAPVLIIGGAYSGKSELAHTTLLAPVATTVIGTADLSEGLIAARVEMLRKMRPSHWLVQQGRLDLGAQLLETAAESPQILLDSVNQWIANLILLNAQKYSFDQLLAHCEREVEELCHSLQTCSAQSRISIVSSEVGSGITPPKPVARLFRQLVSRVNCKVADAAASVLLVTAGIPLLIKGTAEPSTSHR